VPPAALRPRSPTEIIDASVQLMRGRYAEITAVAAVFHAPVAILLLLHGTPPAGPEGLAHAAVTLALTGAQAVMGTLSAAAIVVVASDSYLGRPVTIASAIRRALARSASVIAATALTAGIIFVGFMLFIIPGVIFSAGYCATIAALMVEGLGPRDAMSRARALASGSIKRILAVYCISGVVVWMLYLMILALVTGGSGLLSHVGQVPLTAIRVVAILASVCLFPFFHVVTTVLYYDLRIRKEGFDLQVMAEELSGAVSAVA
jgi:hypothetical protein